MVTAQIKKICIVSNDYPDRNHAYYTFVQQLAYGLSAKGKKVCVIAPLSVTHVIKHREQKLPAYSKDVSPEGNEIEVYRPWIISFGTSSASDSKLTKLQYRSIERSIKRTLKKINDIDVIYCYFWHMGLSAAAVLQDSNIRIVTQASEGEITVPPFLKNKTNLDRVNGVICASRKNYEESKQADLLIHQPSKIVSNGYRTDEFYPADKKVAREQLGFPADKFIVIFVGSFIERKGISQLCEALDQFEDVYSIFIGKGPIQPKCKNVLFSGSVSHNELVGYLNCADAFVLPTRAEGCCNAIVEAIGCGLPIISSNKNFNDEILNKDCSIRVDEQNVAEIANAIRTIKESASLRNKMSLASVQKSKELTIEHRTESILDFLENI